VSATNVAAFVEYWGCHHWNCENLLEKRFLSVEFIGKRGHSQNARKARKDDEADLGQLRAGEPSVLEHQLGR